MGSVSVSVLSLFLCAEQSVFISALHWVTLCSLSVTSHPQEDLEVSGRKYLLKSLLSQKCGVTYGFFWRRTDFRFQASKAQTRKLRFANDKISVKWLMERKSDQLNVFLQLWHFSSFCVFLAVLGLLTYIFRDSLSLTLQATYFRDLLHNGISHCTWEYLPRQHRWKDLPPVLACLLLSFCLCFPLPVWIDLTVLLHLSVQQHMLAILELYLEPGLFSWALGYLTCLTAVCERVPPKKITVILLS